MQKEGIVFVLHSLLRTTFNGKCPNGGVNKCIRFNIEEDNYGYDLDIDDHDVSKGVEYYSAKCSSECTAYSTECSCNVLHEYSCASSSIVSEWVQTYQLEEIGHSNDDRALPDQCMDRSFNLSLHAISGSHFFIGAVITDEVSSKDDMDAKGQGQGQHGGYHQALSWNIQIGCYP